jgi:hypothetical protein
MCSCARRFSAGLLPSRHAHAHATRRRPFKAQRNELEAILLQSEENEDVIGAIEALTEVLSSQLLDDKSQLSFRYRISVLVLSKVSR